jgi:hypothetical protein
MLASFCCTSGAVVRVGAGVGHGQQEGLLVRELEVLVGELVAVDGLSTGTLSRVSCVCA